MASPTMIEYAEELGYIKSGNTDFEKAKSMGIDFNGAIWDISFILKTYKEHGYNRASFMAALLPTMKLGSHKVYKDRGDFLNGFVQGLFAVESGEISLEDLKL